MLKSGGEKTYFCDKIEILNWQTRFWKNRDIGIDYLVYKNISLDKLMPFHINCEKANKCSGKTALLFLFFLYKIVEKPCLISLSPPISVDEVQVSSAFNFDTFDDFSLWVCKIWHHSAKNIWRLMLLVTTPGLRKGKPEKTGLSVVWYTKLKIKDEFFSP